MSDGLDGLDWMDCMDGYPILLWHQEHRSRAMLKIMNYKWIAILALITSALFSITMYPISVSYQNDLPSIAMMQWYNDAKM